MNSPVERDAVVAMTLETVARLLSFYTAEKAERWINAPHPQLDGQSARDLIVSGDHDRLRAVLDQLESGAYV